VYPAVVLQALVSLYTSHSSRR